VAVEVAAFGAFLAFLDSTVVNVAFPNLEAAFPSAGINTLSWALNGYNIIFAGLLVLFGRFADLIGRRRLFRIGLAVFTVASGLCAASTSVPMLVALRVVQGAAAAMLVPASLGIVVHASSSEHRAHSLSLWAAAGALAAGLGPPVGGALVEAYNWRLVFLVNVPLGCAAWFLGRHCIVESRAPGRRVMPDLRGALLLSASVALLTLGVVQGTSWVWDSPATLGAFAAALVGTALTVRSSLRHPSPVLDPVLLRMRAFGVSNLVTLVAGLGLYTYLLALILWLHYVWGYSLLVSGLAVAPGAIVAALVARPCGKLADRFSPRAVVVPGALVWAAAFVWYAAKVGVRPDFLGQWLPAQIASGIGAGSTLVVAAGGGLATVPAGRYATASAVNSSARQLGGVLGIAILTVLLSHPSKASLPVAASLCLPGLFPPQRLDGRVLVDGSLTDNCPTAAFAGVFEGPVLAVRVSAASSPPPGPDLPSLGETLVRVMEMGEGPDQERAEWVVPTVTVTPDTSGVGLLEFHQIERAREAGLHAGRAAVAALYELAVP
jgi:NTE family protein